MCFGEVGNIMFSVSVSGGGSFQANQFIGGRQAISWSHKGVFLAFWPLFDVGCNCLVKLLWHFLRRVAHTMEWLGILRKTLLKSIAHLKTEARQSRGEKTWIRYDDMNDFSHEDIVTHCDTPWLFVWNRFDELIPFDCFDIIRCPNASGDYLLLRWRCVLPYTRRQSWWRCLEPMAALICRTNIHDSKCISSWFRVDFHLVDLCFGIWTLDRFLLEKILVASYFPRHVHQGKAVVRGGCLTVIKL